MTKIKNTKKGMAKKTLSISLAVAMLATSNVPVWAAEDLFTDGEVAVEAFDAAEAFTAEEADAPVVEAPVVEETVDVPEAQVAEGYKVDTNMSLKSVDWNTGLTFAAESGNGKFEITDENGLAVSPSKVEVYTAGSMLKNLEIGRRDTVASVLSGVKIGLANYKLDKTVTIKVYVGEKEVYIASAEVKAVDISDWTISRNTVTSTVYNGKIQEPKVTINDNNGNHWNPGLGTSDVVIRFEDEKEAKNVGSYNFTVEGVEADGYTGAVENGRRNKFTISPAPITADAVAVVISGETTYNAEKTKPTVVVTDLLAGVEIPSYLYTVALNKADAGKYNKDDVTVTFLKDGKAEGSTTVVANNFLPGIVNGDCKKGDFVISALDLSKLTEKYDVVINTRKVNTDVTANDITFVEKATGKKFAFDAIVPAGQITIKTKNNAVAGEGTISVQATSITNTNIINELTGKFTVVENIVTEDDVYFPAGTVINNNKYESKTKLSTAKTDIQNVLDKTIYNEKAQEPLKEAFSKLIINTATVNDQKLVLGTDYDIVYTDNTDSKYVSKKDTTVSLVFKGAYTGTISYSFAIQRAKAFVSGKDIEFVHGQNSYPVSAKVETQYDGLTYTAVPEVNYTVTTKEYATGNTAAVIGKAAKGLVVMENANYVIDGTANNYRDIESKVVARKLENCTAVVEGDYVYTGDVVEPKLTVKDGEYVLTEGVDYKVTSKEGTNAGVAHIVIEGIGVYAGRLTVDYTVTKADMANATVLNADGKENYDVSYTGTALKPDVATVKIGKKELKEYNPIDKTGDYILEWDLNAVEVGSYSFTITAVPGSKNVEGVFSGTFKVIPNKLTGHFANKLNLNDIVNKGTILGTDKTGAFYTGEEIKLDSFKTKYVVVDEKTKKVLTEDKDYRLEYTNNVNAGIATVTAYGIGNHAAVDANGKPAAITSMNFYIGGKDTIKTSWIKKIADVEYAGGLTVEPEVVVMDTNGNRLVQGRDYTVTSAVTEIGEDYDFSDITIKGNGAYTTADKNNNPLEADKNTWKLTWDVTKKDIANTDITVAGGKVIVMNGSVVVPAGEYDAVFSEDGATVTVTAKESSKYYKGSKEVLVDAEVVGKPMISEVKVVGNKVTVILSGEVDNAVGYDYVLSTEEDYKNGRLVNGINKNQVKTETLYQYIQKGTYYAYCHAWKRDENGKKIFGDWSNLYEFNVTATTPDQPVITSVTRKGSDVTVTYTKAANAEGYDIVLGTELKTITGEKRPVEYGTLVKKNVKGNTVTFKNVPEGTYYVGLHAYNRTSLDNKKVFSPWSNSKKVTVK